MDSISNWIEQNVNHRVRVDPLNEIHLPSFVLGCSVIITLSLLGPFMKIFVGGVLLTLVTLVKYMVIIGGITACGLILSSRNKEPNKTVPGEPLPKASEELRKAKRGHKMDTEPEAEVDLAKDNFEQIKYYDIPKTKSQTKRVPTENAYNKFINRALHKEAS